MPANETEKSLERVLASYRNAVRAKDVSAFIALYDPKVRVFDAWGVWSYEGAQAWQVAVEGWFASLGAETVEVTFDDVQSALGVDWATVSAIVTYAGISAQGERLRAMQNRLTWVLRTSRHVLRIVHEHTSAPLGLADSKAILQRETKADVGDTASHPL
jgi:ketosteroid isomerase-like protein